MRTALTERNAFRMPLIMEPERAARIIERGLRRNEGRIAFPWAMYAAAWLGAALPPALMDRLSRRLPRKR